MFALRVYFAAVSERVQPNSALSFSSLAPALAQRVAAALRSPWAVQSTSPALLAASENQSLDHAILLVDVLVADPAGVADPQPRV